jgi:hypothetical protein
VPLDNAAVGSDAGIAHLADNAWVRVARGAVLRPEEMMAALVGIDGSTPRRPLPFRCRSVCGPAWA